MNNETDLSSLPDPKSKNEVIKIRKKLRKIIDRNADDCNKELETVKRSQSKLHNSIAEIKTKLKAMSRALNKAEE